MESLKKKEAEANEIKKAEVKALADRLGALSLTISASAGEEEKLFGSVSSEDIAEALALENIKVDKRDIILEDPIRKLGPYQVTVKLHPEVKATLKVWIVKK